MFGMSCAAAEIARNTHTSASAARKTKWACVRRGLADDNPAAETVVFVVNSVIVELTGARRGERTRRAALPGRQEAHDVDLGTIAMIGIRAALDVVRDVVVVDERHAAADANRGLERKQTEWRDRHARGERGCSRLWRWRRRGCRGRRGRRRDRGRAGRRRRGARPAARRAQHRYG